MHSRQTTSRRKVPLGVSAVRSPRSCPHRSLMPLRPWAVELLLGLPPKPPSSTRRVQDHTPDISYTRGCRAASESLGIEFDASGDRSICVGALNQQDRHGTLLVDLLPQGHIAIRDLAGQKMVSDYGQIKCHFSDI